MEEVIGRADLLSQVSRGAAHLDDLDLNPLLLRVDDGADPHLSMKEPRNDVPDTLDAADRRDAQPFLIDGEKMQLAMRFRTRTGQSARGRQSTSSPVWDEQQPAAKPSDGET